MLADGEGTVPSIAMVAIDSAGIESENETTLAAAERSFWFVKIVQTTGLSRWMTQLVEHPAVEPEMIPPPTTRPAAESRPAMAAEREIASGRPAAATTARNGFPDRTSRFWADLTELRIDQVLLLDDFLADIAPMALHNPPPASSSWMTRAGSTPVSRWSSPWNL